MLSGSKPIKHAIMLFGDFYLVDVKYDEQTGLASDLLICEPRNFQPGATFWANREAVISLIEDGYHVELLPPDGPMSMKRWFVRVVELAGKKYLRLDRELIASDKLAKVDC